MDIDEIVPSDHQENHNGSSNDYEVTYNSNEHNQYEYPKLFNSKTLLELCYSSSPSLMSKGDVQPYLRGCKWSPDGTCCLSVVNNDGVHVTELPRDLYSGSVDSKRKIDVLDPVIHVKESGLIYDFCWYPGMNSTIPESCCWITTRQNAPIQMWDAFDGSLRCSYRGFNAVDEMEPAISVTFNNEGNRIIGGYKKVLRTFDVERPGRDYAEHKINSPASCFATSGNLLAVGSWNSTISLFNVNEMGNYKSIGKMHGHTGGVTHAKFTPDGLKLVSGSRKDHRLLIWDIRYYRTPLNILSRAVDTNQRVYFDISPCGKYLVSGGTDGLVKVWDSNKVNWHSRLDVTDGDKYNVTYIFPLHKDCCNSVSIHPCRPILATGSGQYHFKDPLAITSDEKIDEIEKNQDTKEFISDMKYSDEAENSLVFWWTGDIDV
ncbi:telomerase Cajal body protein 1 homolog [Papilio machaon]|uniref:telomerase Cajal body protein 1 homolog n=1 Tax=Papilio machaon TaxID=76193 RepID=UPI001E66367A|nr:telomerase Cajal body protein 1 homolog [Papilio machaon]